MDVELDLINFAFIYVLLLIIIAVMRRSRIDQTKTLVVACLRMTVQLVLAGLLLTFVFDNPSPWFTSVYVLVMVLFASYLVISKNRWLNRKFKTYVILAIGSSGISVLLYFILIVMNADVFNPQYAIPLAGMIVGNSMTGMTLGLRSFGSELTNNSDQMEALLNIGAEPRKIMNPFVNKAVEFAMMPTITSMLGMGIISLPGMMTGQILAGTEPTAAVLYQIAILIAISVAVCMTVFIALNLGYKTLYNERNQMTFSLSDIADGQKKK
ncbi:MAG: iron export ABC transporter permease subunit FetB [Methanomassiliicoccaceae archaeon]|jgi:putative ABC transport system permease protein|nr:iron export ABC transporter permease subunit FetB [Methanomassiliicoccaceae archaeon]